MDTTLIIMTVAAVLSLAAAVFSILTFVKKKDGKAFVDEGALEAALLRALRGEDEKRRGETEKIVSALDGKIEALERKNEKFTAEVREGMINALSAGKDSTRELFRAEEEQMARFSQSIAELEKEMRSSFESFRKDTSSEMERIREENRVSLESFRTEAKNMSDQVRRDMNDIRTGNEKKLDEMRATVDEKLTQTLDERLGKSFELVTSNLNSLREALGEINKLSQDVGDLNKLFGNVKARGVWGEVQVESILSDILSPEQYVRNYHARPRSQEAVEFAIRLPGRDEEGVYIPIDSKFPKEDYERYATAMAEGDHETADLSLKALRDRVRREAMDIHSKYINPPRTTDFAILFVPTESLYAELLRMPGFSDELRQRYSVILSGPTTFSALVVSLQMGFRTLQIERKTKEVSDLFAKIKLYMNRFARELDGAQKSIDTAARKVDRIIKTNGRISLKLDSVEMADPEKLTEEEKTLLIGESDSEADGEAE